MEERTLAIRSSEKVCPRCDQVYLKTHFKEKGGRSSYCDKCWRDYSRERQRAYRLRKFQNG